MGNIIAQVALPRETTTGKCFLQHYIESILALQEASCKLVEGMWTTLYMCNELVTNSRDDTSCFDKLILSKYFSF